MTTDKKIVVFDGVDGAGKTTLIQGVANHLRSLGFKVDVFSAIGAGPIGKVARERLLKDKIDMLGDALLSSICHWELNYDMIPKSTADYILLDRWVSSMYVYQYYIHHANHTSNGLGEDVVLKIFDTHLSHSHAPSIVFNLQVDENIARERLIARGESLNRLDKISFKLKQEGFAEFMDIYQEEYGGNVVNLPCNGSKEHVCAMAISKIEEHFKQNFFEYKEDSYSLAG